MKKITLGLLMIALSVLCLACSGQQTQNNDQTIDAEWEASLMDMMVNRVDLPNIEAGESSRGSFAEGITATGDFEIVFSFHHQGNLSEKNKLSEAAAVRISTSGLGDYGNARTYTLVCNGEVSVDNSATVIDASKNWSAEPQNSFMMTKGKDIKGLLSDADVTLTIWRRENVLSVSGVFTHLETEGIWSARIEEANFPETLNIYLGAVYSNLSHVCIAAMRGNTLFHGSGDHNVQYRKISEYIQKIQNVHASYDMPSGSASGLKGVENVHLIAMLTGEASMNKTESRFQLCGTDVGIPIVTEDKIYYLFGDSFYSTYDPEWINNCLE